MSRQRKHEAPEMGAMIERVIRGMVKRAAEGDAEALVQLVKLQQPLRDAITAAGTELHDGFGYSYTYLAGELGISRQAARQRFTAPAVLAGDQAKATA